MVEGGWVKSPHIDIYIVTCQAHPVLVKTGQMYGLCLFFFKFFLGKGSLNPCLVAARSPGWFVGDPTLLARYNISVNNCMQLRPPDSNNNDKAIKIILRVYARVYPKFNVVNG